MSYRYTIARFDPDSVAVGATDDQWKPMQTRDVSAETEDEALDLVGDPGDGTYWEVIDTDDPAVTRINGGRT